MIEHAQPAGSHRDRGRSCLPALAILATAVAVAAVGAGRVGNSPRPALVRTAPATEPPVHEARGLSGSDAIPADALDPWRATLGGRLSRWAWTPETPSGTADQAQADAAGAVPPDDAAIPPIAQAAPPLTAMTVPLPVPRPVELRGSGAPARRAARTGPRQVASLPAPPPEDNRSFLEKLFGVENTPAHAYTALESKPADLAPRLRLSPPLAPPISEGGIAIYDISARAVTLPNGDRLEAHSGLGEIMDDPRYVNVRMRGATPPGTYLLTERDQLFHGVRAIRLTPVGGAEAVYGRVGLLAHTFMLGPTGASNGCVSFRDYNRFLEAYLRGEIRQLVVVAGAGGATPTLARANEAAVRLARN